MTDPVRPSNPVLPSNTVRPSNLDPKIASRLKRDADGLVPAVAHFDEREPPGPAGLPVHDHLNLGDSPEL